MNVTSVAGSASRLTPPHPSTASAVHRPRPPAVTAPAFSPAAQKQTNAISTGRHAYRGQVVNVVVLGQMGLIHTFDDKFGTPYSEVELASGEHIFVSLDRKGLTIKVLAQPGSGERVLFEASPDTTAKICAGLFDDQGYSRTTPLRILVSALTQLPNAAAVASAFRDAAAVVL